MTLCDDGACGHFGSGGFIIFEIQEGQEDFLVSELIPMAMLGVLGIVWLFLLQKKRHDSSLSYPH